MESRRLILNMYLEQKVNVLHMDHGEANTQRQEEQACVRDASYHSSYSISRENGQPRKYFGKKLETSKQEAVIEIIRCADNVVLLAKEDETLQGIIDRLAETGINCEMEVNVNRSKAMRISGRRSPRIVVENKNQEKLMNSAIQEDQ